MSTARAGGDVVESGAVTPPHANQINVRINETEWRFAVHSRLLIDQSHVTGPHGRRKTGPAELVCSAGGLVGTHVKGIVGVGRYVGAVAKGRRSLVARVDHARELLPRGNRDLVRGDAVAAIHPGGFRAPWTARAGGYQIR